MTDKELKRLGRKELLEILIEQDDRINRLEASLDAARKALEDRSIKMKSAGTVAEAAFCLNNVYEVVDNAAKEYLQNIKRCSEQQQAEYDRIIRKANEEADLIIANAEKAKKLKMDEADNYWRSLSQKLDEFSESHPELKEILTAHFEMGTR